MHHHTPFYLKGCPVFVKGIGQGWGKIWQAGIAPPDHLSPDAKMI